MQRVRTVVNAVAGLVLLATACSSGPTVAEYAQSVEALVAEMDAKFVDLSEEVSAAEPTLDLYESVLNREIAIVADFTEAFRDLEPATEAEELHATSLRVLERRVEAERALLAEVEAVVAEGTTDNVFELISQLEQTDVMAEMLAADTEMFELCRAAQDQLNTTEDQASLAGLPWVPTELKEAVQVTLNCE